MAPENRREFKDTTGETWTVTRDTGFRFGASAQGTLPSSGVRGLHFTSPKGATRFLARGLDDLPDRKQLKDMTEDQLRELLDKAAPG